MMIPLEMQAARINVLHHHPYLASAVWAMHMVPVPGLKTMAVDQYFRLYFDPEIITKWSVREVATVIEHEVAHLMRLHFVRMKGCEPQLANIAADAEINDDMFGSDFAFPFTPVTPKSINQPIGLLAEEYYAALLEQAQPLSIELSGDGSPLPGSGRCGSCATGTPQPWEMEAPQGADANGVTPAQAELIRRDVATKIKASTPGTVAKSWKRWADEVLSPKVNWRKELAAVVRHSVAYVIGSTDFSYRRPSRRQGKSKVILPTMQQPTPEVAIIIDTSGSIDEKLLSQSLGEVAGILKAVGLRNGVAVLAVDAHVQTTKRVLDSRQVTLKGGGGTNMGVGIVAATKLKPRPQVVIVLTDGFTPWPESMPRGLKRVIVCLLGVSAPDGPSWATNIRIET
jgi:predicted metal-dependent peptidase